MFKHENNPVKPVVSHPYFTCDNVITQAVDITGALGANTRSVESFRCCLFPRHAQNSVYEDEKGINRNKVLSYQVGSLNVRKKTYHVRKSFSL